MTSTESTEAEVMVKDESLASSCAARTELSLKNLDKKFRCKICDLNFMNEAMLLTHAEAVHGSRPLEQVVDLEEPDTENEEISEKEENKIDKVEVSQEVYLCSACGEIFMVDTEMENHCRIAHDAASQRRIYECSECYKQFDTEVAFDAHSCDDTEPGIAIVTPAESDVSVYECAVLELSQKRNELMCDICSIIFVSKYALNRHCEIVHRICPQNSGSPATEMTENGLHQCSRCFDAFVDMRALKNHSVEVHKMKWNNVKQRTPQFCHVCNKRFSSMGNLNKHLRVVHATRPREKGGNSGFVVECVGDVDTEESEAAEKISQVNSDTTESVHDLPDYTTNAESGSIIQVGQSEREQLKAMFGETQNVTMVVIEPGVSGFETKEVTELITKPLVDTEPEPVVLATSESVEIVVSDSVESVPNSSSKNDAVVKTRVTDGGGTISIDEQTMIVEADSKLTGYVLELDESLYNVLDSGEVHMVIEDRSEKENVQQGSETMVTDSSVSKRTKSEAHCWYCSPCSLLFDDKETLLVHHRQHHLPEECEPETNSPQQCEICLKLFSTKGNRDKHVNTVHRVTEGKLLPGDSFSEGEIRIACDYCEKSFHQKTNYTKHMRYAHPDHRSRRKRMKLNKDATDADRTCHICGKQFTDLMKKEMHVYNHSRNEKEYRCDVCHRTFNRRDYFKEHYEKKHGVPRFECSFCDKRFVRKSYLIVHERVHTNIRPYVCKTCGKGFKQWGGLHQHQRFHTAKPPATHFCGQCHRGYSYKVDLDRHMIVHSDKKHVCAYCSKPFPTASQLTVHIRTHTGQRPYKCGLCSMCFMTMGGLKRHGQIHERRDQGGFMCAICGVSYRRQASVDEHIRVFHAERVAEPIEVQSVDLIQESQCAENHNEEVIEFVVENDGTVQVGETGLQVLARCDNTWVDTTDIEKELVEGILASQTVAENLIVTQTQESEGT